MPKIKNKKVFLTGASGSMGSAVLTELLKENKFDVIILIRDSKVNRQLMQTYVENANLTIYYGDLTVYDDVHHCVQGADIILHVAAFVSPAADDYPAEAMKINYGGTVNLIKAIKAQPDPDKIRFVNIGTIAETGDRMPPIHWGRVGDPIKPSIFDYYAVSKIAAERAVIESGLKYWVSLRQTGILSEKMVKHNDPIMFHNCLDNVLEYVSDRDSAIMMKNCCEDLPEDFWRHIYNVGGGEPCRISCYNMFEKMFQSIGFKNLEYILDAKWFATRNFHGTYYLDSDKLNDYLHFRNDTLDYLFDLYEKNLGTTVYIARIINKLPGGEKFMGKMIRKRFQDNLYAERGTLNWIEHNDTNHIAAYFISKEHWENIPALNKMEHFKAWNQVIYIDHGYDETKPENQLNLEDVKGAAVFRGGQCVSEVMETGDWTTKLTWKCCFGHEFEASPRLVLEGGHWCDECERISWNYHEIAKRSPFFAQVWYPLHDVKEPSREYKKLFLSWTVK